MAKRGKTAGRSARGRGGVLRAHKEKKDGERNGTEERYAPIQLPASLCAAELHLIQEVQTVLSSERVRAYNLPR